MNVNSEIFKGLNNVLNSHYRVKYNIENRNAFNANIKEIFVFSDNESLIQLTSLISSIINGIEDKNFMRILTYSKKLVTLKSKELKDILNTDSESALIARHKGLLHVLLRNRKEFPEYSEILKLFFSIVQVITMSLVALLISAIALFNV